MSPPPPSPVAATAAVAVAAVLAAAAHVACHRRQPTKSCCYFRQQFQLHYTRLSCCRLWLPLAAAAAGATAAASCCCHIMEMSSCSPLRFHKRVDLQPFNTSDDPEHATTETTTNIPLSYLQQAVAPSTTSVALNVQRATCGTAAAASAQLS